MPIANCYINGLIISKKSLKNLTVEWAETIEVDLKDICLTFVDTAYQTGQTYKVMVNLYLPSLWSKKDVNKIQQGLLNQFIKHFALEPHEIFIITTIIQSGNVVENGETMEW